MKSILLFAVCLITLNLTAQFPTTSLTVSYPFTNGSTNDVSGNNNHLTAFNGPTPCPDRFNNPNCAYLLDGTNDYFKAINPGPMNHKSRSIIFWAKTIAPFNSDGYTVLYYGEESTGGGRIEYGLNSSCNSLYVDYGYGFISKPFATTDNMWHMYTIVYDSTLSYQITSVKYYVDASLIGTSCYTYNTTQTINTQPMDPITIGKFSNSLPRYFNGAIDDIHVYERPLTPGEVVTIFTLPNTVKQNDLVGSSVSIFPNPSNDFIEIKSEISGNSNIVIYNAFGQLMLTKISDAEKTKVDVQALASGVYFVQIKTNEYTITRKFIKN